MKRLLIICGLAALLAVPTALLVVPRAFAAAALVVNPAAPTALAPFSLSGCGYPANAPLMVDIIGSGTYFVGQNLTADASGCFTSTWTAGTPGPYRATSHLVVKQGSKSRIYTQAVLDFTVVWP